VASSRDILFNRLEKLHEKDPSKCLEVSKRYMSLFPENASSYYFASVIYDERADKSKTVQGKYRNLKKAIGYAITFEEKDADDLASEVNWDDFRSKLSESSRSTVEQLELANESKYSADLLSTLRGFDENVTIEVADVDELKASPETPKVEGLSAAEVVKVGKNSTVEFFGLPRGTEIIESADLQGEQAVLALINEERVRQGMAPLEWDENLARAARYHAYDLATQDYFNHDSYDRKNGKLVEVGGTFERIRKFYSASFVNSENIAAGNASAEATYNQWFNSPGHYANMFNSASRKVGLGVFEDENSTYGYYWVFCTAH
jgi:uncharacterized protein YkwD